MASNLQNAAAKAVMKQHPCSFYDSIHSIKTNPVLVSFKKEKQNFIDFVSDKKKSKMSLTSELHGRLSMMLFEIWNKYQSLLSQDYYRKQLLEIGNFLVEQKEYSLALSLCFDRLLYELNIKKYDVKTLELIDYQNWHFPNGLQADTTILTIQALIGKYICSFYSVKMSNSMLTCPMSVNECLHILSLLRVLSQILLPCENWCWLLYNCTIHTYTICQEMMLHGNSPKVLEFLVWACMCLENSLPLLSVQFLTWRSTLYMAVCYCYWDSVSGQQAEAFARRALCKISDLWQIEKLKEDGQILHKDINSAFRESTLKMALMIFRRAVFETRRKHRTVIRMKNRFNIKDYLNVTWPRTQTEKLIMEMFDCGSAQILAILESLNNSRQRIVQTNGCSQWEIELIDTVSELFLAAKEILSGNSVSGTTSKKSKKDQPVIGFVNLIETEETTLMELATAGDNRIPVRAVFQLARLAFCYEQWDIFDSFAEPLKVVSNLQYSWDVKSLEILSAIERIVSGRKRRKSQPSTAPVAVGDEESSKLDIGPTTSATSIHSGSKTNGDDLIPLAQVLNSVLMEKFTPQQVDLDLVVDAVLLLWNKSKVIIQRHQTGSEDKSKYFQKPENQSRWLHILDITLRVMCWCGMAAIDTSILMEVAMRLALLLETSASTTALQKMTETATVSMKDSTLNYASDEELSASSACSLATDFLGKSKKEMLKIAKSALETTLEQVAKGRNTDERHIADVSWIKQHNPEMCEKFQTDEDGNEKTSKVENPFEHLKLLESTIRSQHTELLLIYYRILFSLRNLEVMQAKASTTKSLKKADLQSMNNCTQVLETLQVACGANNLQKSLLYMQASISMDTCSQQERKEILQQSLNFLEKFQKEELKLFQTNTDALRNSTPEKRKQSLNFLEKFQKEELKLFQTNTDALRNSTPEKRKQSLNFLEKFQKEELKLFQTNTDALRNSTPEKRKVPPAPILLHRSGSKMILKPAPFVSADGDSVCWYRLFACSIKTSNPKVRMNDMPVNGTGELVLSDCEELTVLGLNLNQRYLFALAAYTSEGKLIGGGIGESTKPILAMNPVSILITYSFLCQTAYQLKFYSIFQHAFNFLWSHFVTVDKPKLSSDSFIHSTLHQFKISRPKLNKQIVTSTAVSPFLMRQMYCCVMSQVNIVIQQWKLACNKLCDQGRFIDGQKKRLKECEKLFVAIEIAGWLNDYQLCLQAIVQCYGLLVPLLYHQVAIIPVAQVFLQCLAALQELPASIRQKRPASTAESLHHMTACMVYHAAKILFEFNEKNLALRVYDVGLNLLQQNLIAKKSTGQDSNQTSSINLGGTTEEKLSLDWKTQSQINFPNFKQSLKRPTHTGVSKHDYLLDLLNEEVISLEVAMIRTSKQTSNENDLSLALSQDNPRLALANIYVFPSLITAKEVNKFKKRTSYPDLLIRAIEKAFSEGNHLLTLTLSEDLYSFIRKKNESNHGIKYKKHSKKGKTTEPATSDKSQRFAATVVEYGKDKEATPRTPERKPSEKASKKKKKRLFQNDPPEVEAAKMNALEILSHILLEQYYQIQNKKLARKILADELPLQSQLFMFLGLSYFNVFFEKLEQIKRTQANMALTNYGSFYDDNWFSFENTGMLLFVENKVNEQPLKLEKEKTPIEKKEKSSSHNKFPVIQINYPNGVTQTIELNTPGIQDILRKSLTYLQKSMVLAHRGNMWSLLQNNAKILWDMIETIQFRLISVDSESAKDTLSLSFQTFNILVYPMLTMASDLLLDMLKTLQAPENSPNDKEKQEETNVSWEYQFGSIQNKKGGSLLSFERFLDDTTIIDIRLVQKICMKAMAVIQHQRKWERLADIVLRFNALTNDRFAEFTLPLLIDAQNNLLDMIKDVNKQSLLPQPHIKRLMDEVGDRISAKDYLHAQFKISLDKKETKPMQSETYLAFLGNKSHRESIVQNYLISVPLDVEDSWMCLENIINATNYGAHALIHCRRLLGIYIIGQQQLKYQEITEEEKIIRPFSLSIKKLLEPLPNIDINNFYEDNDNTLTSEKARDQLEKVIICYSQTTEILLNKNQDQLAAQALTELGNVHFVAGNGRMAFKSWKKSLKLILNLNEKSVLDWKQLYPNEDPGLQLLQSCGIWGCLHGAIVATNIARYIVSNDWLLSLQYCILASNLFKALFRCSIHHPLSNRQYALYEIGEGCPITYLIPGVHIFTDQYRCNARQLLSSLQFIISKLYSYEYYLEILPLLALHLYFARSLCRDVKLYVQGQIQKVLTLTNLRLFSDAIKTLQQLLHGERLPQLGSPYFRPVEVKIEPLEFESSLCFSEMINIKVFESITEKYLLNNLNLLYGFHLSNELLLAHAHLLVSLAECLEVIPDEKESENAMATTLAGMYEKHLSTDGGRQSSSLRDSLLYQEKYATLEKIKNRLLVSATSRLDILMEELQLKSACINNKLEARELHLAIQCLLEQSNISLQKQQSYFAQKYCSQALNMLQHSKLFCPDQKPCAPKRRSSKLSLSSIASNIAEDECKSKYSPLSDWDQNNQDILGCQQWLQCRLRLVQAMQTDVSVPITLSEVGETVTPELPSFELLCKDGQDESQTWNNPEMEAAFIRVQVVKMFEMTHCGKACEPLLQKGINLLKSCPDLSYSGFQNLLEFYLLKTDLKIGSTGPLTTSMVKRTLKSYIQIQNIVEKLLQDLGESIQHTATINSEPITCPVIPLKNIYLSPLNILVQVKLRISLMMAKLYLKPINLCTTPEVQQRNSYLLDCLAVLKNAQQLNRKCFFWNAGLEVEILLQIGKLEREMAKLKKIPPFIPMCTFLDAIKVSFFAHHSLILIKNAYLEIALIAASQLKKTESFICQRTKAKSNFSGRLLHFSILGYNPSNQFAMIAWLAVRSAAIITSCRNNMTTLTQPGKLGIYNELSEEAKNTVPDFLNLDLFGKYLFGKKKKFYKNEFEEDYDQMMQAGPVEKEPSKEERLKEIKEFSSRHITWSFVLCYLFHLFEKQHREMVSVNRTLQEKEKEEEDEEDVEVNSRQSQTTFHQAFLCSLKLGLTQEIRYASTYHFLTENFSIFNKQCSVSYPAAKLEELIEHKTPPQAQNTASDTDRFSNFQEEKTLPSEFQKSEVKDSPEQKLPYPNVNEVCFQWYSPSFDSIITALNQNQSPIYLLCTATKKKDKPGEVLCLIDYFLFPHHFITDIYKRIKKTIHLKEVQQKTASPLQQAKTTGGVKRKSKPNTSLNSSDITSDAETELQKEIFLILEDIQVLLKPKAEKLFKAPFELNNPNLNQLLEMFDVSSGSCLITSDIASWILKLIFP